MDRVVLEDLADFARANRVSRLVFRAGDESVELDFLPPEAPRAAAAAPELAPRSNIPAEARALGGAYASPALWRHLAPEAGE